MIYYKKPNSISKKKIIIFLIENGIDINTVDEYINILLILAAIIIQKNKKKIVEYFFKKKTDVNIVNNKAESVLMNVINS